MIKVTRRDRGSVVILELSGRLMGGPDADLIKKQVRDLQSEGRTQVVIDLGNVAWVNSSGLGTLIATYTTLKSSGGCMKLLNVSKRIEQILAVTKLNTVFETYADEEVVVGSFADRGA